jgi:hypothetical protein
VKINVPCPGFCFSFLILVLECALYLRERMKTNFSAPKDILRRMSGDFQLPQKGLSSCICLTSHLNSEE